MNERGKRTGKGRSIDRSTKALKKRKEKKGRKKRQPAEGGTERAREIQWTSEKGVERERERASLAPRDPFHYSLLLSDLIFSSLLKRRKEGALCLFFGCVLRKESKRLTDKICSFPAFFLVVFPVERKGSMHTPGFLTRTQRKSTREWKGGWTRCELSHSVCQTKERE